MKTNIALIFTFIALIIGLRILANRITELEDKVTVIERELATYSNAEILQFDKYGYARLPEEEN